VASLGSISVGFELLKGTTPEVGRTLEDVINERIVGVVAEITMSESDEPTLGSPQLAEG
jgi:hypothetical protein